MKVFKTGSNISWIVLAAIIFSGCDFVGEDYKPTGEIKKIDVLKLKNNDFAIDLSSAYPGYNYKGVSPGAEKYVSYYEEENILVYNPKEAEKEEEFQIEFQSNTNNFVIGDVKFKELAAAECGAQNFTSATISNDSKFTVDILLNEDMCGAKDIDINSLTLYEKYLGNTTGDEFEEAQLRGYTGIGPGAGYIIYTFDPKDDFVGIVEMEYFAAIHFDKEASLEDIYANPELSEFYTKHKLTIEVTD